jgi:hypothetical protein
MITQFNGESRRDAIINHFSLDSIEEGRFFLYIKHMGYTIDAEDEIIENLHKMWDEKINNG